VGARGSLAFGLAMDPREDEKRAAAQVAAQAVEAGMRLGLGTGSTVAHFLVAVARRELADLVCVATSPATEEAARSLGLPLQPFDLLDRLDLAVDGADQVAPDLWLVKGGGGAHTREKIVAASADRFLVVVSSEKLVDVLRPPVPLEVMRFGLGATLRRLSDIGPVEVRENMPPTPEGNLIVDYLGEIADREALSAALAGIAGVVDHGLYPSSMVTEVLIGHPQDAVERLSS
jgi:ribose 5-phosphate isomerase A